MDTQLYQNHLKVLKSQLKLALGCTEPIAIAYAAATARKILDAEPAHMDVYCSGNIIKNVQGVIVPNSNKMRGVDVAAVLGMVGGDAGRQLEVLESVTAADIARTQELIRQRFCTCHLVENVENLYIRVELYSGEHSAEVELKDHHTNITLIKKDHEILLREKHTDSERPCSDEEGSPDLLTIDNILEFADTVELEDIREVIGRQIACNSAISEEGMKNPWGTQVGMALLTRGPDTTSVRARAAAAAGSDARMNGCTLPAVINSGSGNQGITVTMPTLVYAKELGVHEDQLYRALVVANLIAIHQKKYIGSLSAYCGAVSAAAGAACGIAYMMGEPKQVVYDTITNSIATIGGMVCDGAKSSCAAKISAAVETALLGLEMARQRKAFQNGEGLVKENAESTIRSVGRMARTGMKGTDVEILKIMLNK